MQVATASWPEVRRPRWCGSKLDMGDGSLECPEYRAGVRPEAATSPVFCHKA
jgi:hypothetical protein